MAKLKELSGAVALVVGMSFSTVHAAPAATQDTSTTTASTKKVAKRTARAAKSKNQALDTQAKPANVVSQPATVAPVVAAPVVAAPIAPPAPAVVEPPKPVDKAPEADKGALAKKEGDVDNQKILKEVLEKQDKNYTLLKKGMFEVNYDFNYTFYSSERLVTVENASGGYDLAGVASDSSHIVTNSLSVDYGFRDWLTLSASVPFVSKYDQAGATNRQTMNGIGDVSTSVRWQPYGIRPNWPSVTVSGSMRLPTGVSPYEVAIGKEMSTGSGTFGMSGSVNLSKVLDPVVLFASGGYSYSFKRTGLNQLQSSGKRLTGVQPAGSMSLGMGFGYSLSYEVSINASLSTSFSGKSKYYFNDGSAALGSPSASGSLNIGVGLRLDPKYSLNVSTSMGLTRGAPDFSVGFGLPINF